MATSTLLMSASDSPGTVDSLSLTHIYLCLSSASRASNAQIAHADIYVHACSYISTYDSLHMGQDAYVSMILQAAETFGTTIKDEL